MKTVGIWYRGGAGGARVIAALPDGSAVLTSRRVEAEVADDDAPALTPRRKAASFAGTCESRPGTSTR